jgi:hypothetical protein
VVDLRDEASSLVDDDDGTLARLLRRAELLPPSGENAEEPSSMAASITTADVTHLIRFIFFCWCCGLLLIIAHKVKVPTKLTDAF